MQSLNIQAVNSGLGIAGVGYLVVPELKDREQYIKDCYRTNTITIQGGTGYGYIDNVSIDANVLQNMFFPTDENARGTTVVWIKDTVSQRPVVVGWLRGEGEYFALHPDQFRETRVNGKKVVTINLDAETSEVQINALGDKEAPAKITLKCQSPNKDSVFTISSDNEISVESDKTVHTIVGDEFQVLVKNNENKDSVKLSMKTQKGLFYEDEFKNTIEVTDGDITMHSEKTVNITTAEAINLGGGKEPMVLGKTLVDILGELCDAIGGITVTIVHPGGTSPINNKAKFPTIKEKLEDILSKLSNTD